MSTNVNVSTSGTSPTASGTYRTRDLTGRSTIAGLFHDRTSAERAINELKDAGFAASDVGVAMRDRTEQGQLVEDTGTNVAGGAATGAVGGGLLGGIVGFLVGIGALAIPGIGPVLAGGALATAFGVAGGTAVAGAGIGAAAGGLVGALVGMGIPEDEAKHFETGFREGGVLVTVNARERAMEALGILERNGADTGPDSVGSASRSTAATEGMTGTTRPGHSGAGEVAGGALAGGAAGAVAGTAVGGPVGTVVGGVGGAVAGGAAGKAVHEARDPAHRDEADEGAAGGAVAGGAAGAAVGTAVAGPAGTLPGAAIGAAAGAGTGAGVGATIPEDDEWTTDANGNRVRRTRPNP
jgi:hypothetical protein